MVGRTTLDDTSCIAQSGLMPNPENGCSDLYNIFINHIYNQSNTTD